MSWDRPPDTCHGRAGVPTRRITRCRTSPKAGATCSLTSQTISHSPVPNRDLRPAKIRMAGRLQARLVNASVGNEVAVPGKGLVNIAGGQTVVGQFILMALFAAAAP